MGSAFKTRQKAQFIFFQNVKSQIFRGLIHETSRIPRKKRQDSAGLIT